MIKIKAEKLLRLSTEDMWNKLEGDFIIVFANGELITNEKDTIYSSYVWDFHRKYPNTPLLKEHHVRDMTGSGEAAASAHLKLINKVFWSTYDANSGQYKDRRDLLDDLSRMAYQITNRMYNELSYRLEAYVTSLDIMDFISITKSSVVENALEIMAPTEEGIGSIGKLLQDLIKEEPAFRRNPLAIAIRTGISRMGQALQCLGPRGFLTDVDSHIFRYPIASSYIQGIRGLYESMIESRSAAKSLISSTKPLQDSEYFSRRQQLICQNVKNLHLGDCGSTEYLLWHVRDVRYEGTTKVSNGDLPTISGKYYLDEETNQLKVVKASDKHLIGKTIRMRSVVAGCNHPDPYGVCEVCYGETALAVPHNSNLGHIACVSMTAVLGQLILSTKHFDGSSVVEGIVLKTSEKKYLSSEVNGSSYYLNEKLKGKRVKIYVNCQDASGLPDVKLVNDVAKLNITRISEFPMIMISVEDNKGNEDITSLNVGVNTRHSSMTHDLLRFIKKKGYAITDDGKYEFDLTEWDYSLPIFTLPMSHYNTSQHQSSIASMLESTSKEIESRNNTVAPEAFLVDFYDLVNRRLQVNLSVLEVIQYSSMIVDALEGNYDLPKVGDNRGLGVMRQLIQNRSLSAQMGYQSHRETFTDPTSFTHTNRMDHIFDSAILPDEVLCNH